MQTDDFIQRASFSNEWHKVRVNLLYSAEWLRTHVKRFLKQYQLTQQQFQILQVLRDQYPNSIHVLKIRDQMIVRMSDTSRLVERLQKKDLVLKRSGQHDKRQTEVLITKAGLDLLSSIDQSISQLDSILFNLSEADARYMNALLNKMRQDD